ncbi:alpha/beta fold hydrolase [Leifsonia sp. YIM 134122]|uniref:Alpha/beta fold hydrolase n=1 Tax=Leifsonia stereocauli TaxID=3134136 RepID=A0ABU9W7L8_9MICO
MSSGAHAPTRVLVLHSAGLQSPGEGSSDLVDSLRASLGSAFAVDFPIMPTPDDPTYEAWKGEIVRLLDAAPGPVLVVGHSLGASVVLKLLVEGPTDADIRALFLVATPYWGNELEEFVLPTDFARRLPAGLPIFLYQARDDDVVPADHLDRYARELPDAEMRRVDRGGHVFSGGLPELVADIRAVVD